MAERPREPIHAPLPETWLGPRILIRPFQERESLVLWQVLHRSREYLGAWLPWIGFYQSDDDAIAFIRRAAAQYLTREDFNLGIFDRATGEFLGGIGFHARNWRAGAFEIGYWIRPESQRQGYISEAVKLLATFLFRNWDANRVMIRCDARNERSANVARRLGFVYEGTHRGDTLGANGDLRDTMFFALIRRDFDQVNRDWATGARVDPKLEGLG